MIFCIKPSLPPFKTHQSNPESEMGFTPFPIPTPFDIISDVLSRLPAKSLVRFRCVCKLWYSSQCDPYFIQTHSSRSKQRLASSKIMISCISKRSSNQCFVLSELRTRNKSEKSVIFTSEYSLFSQIINCLICLIDINTITVCNLSTREILRLPNSSTISARDESRRRYYPCYLFGSDDSGKIYKVLNICTVSLTDKNQRQRSRKTCEIFTVGTSTNSWRKINSRPFRLFPSRSKPASGHYNHYVQSVCINGVIHWIQHEDMNGGRTIGSFHVRDERFLDLIPFPENVRFENPTLMEYRGCLSLLHYSPVFFPVMSIWVLENGVSNVWKRSAITPLEIRTRAFTMGAFDYHRNMILGNSLHGFLKQFVPSSLLRESGNYYWDEKLLVRFSAVDSLDNILPLKRFAEFLVDPTFL